MAVRDRPQGAVATPSRPHPSIGARRPSFAPRSPSTTLRVQMVPSRGLDPAIAQHVRELIQYLPEIDQEIVRLVYWEGFSQEEVATILGKPATTVRARLSRARAILREQLAESGDVE